MANTAGFITTVRGPRRHEQSVFGRLREAGRDLHKPSVVGGLREAGRDLLPKLVVWYRPPTMSPHL